MNQPHRRVSARTLAKQLVHFALRLEILESRLPPGDALLGVLWTSGLPEK